MKKTIGLIIILIAFAACKETETRYTQKSAEIDSYKAAIASYEKGDWEGYMSHFADTAKIYHNTETEALSPKQTAEGMAERTAPLSSYGFAVDAGDLEMVLTDEGETWVNFWGVWKGVLAANNKEVIIPVHTTAQFVDGKIVKEYGYWDTSGMMAAMMELEEAAKAKDDTTLIEN